MDNRGPKDVIKFANFLIVAFDCNHKLIWRSAVTVVWPVIVPNVRVDPAMWVHVC